MSVPTAALSSMQPDAPAADGTAGWRGWLGGGRLLVVLGAVALAIGLLSLTVPSTPSYDPWSWLVWGHEIVHLGLHTQGGPSWKPLPMLFTTVFGLFGHLQPNMWLVVSRAGATFAVLMCFKLAWRLTRDLGESTADGTGAARTLGQLVPILAGLIAAGSLINSSGFVSNNALGYSEGLATGLMLCAVDRFLDGSRRQALVLGFFVALDRPETWPFWGLYGLWLGWRDPTARRLVGGLFVLTLVLWFGPAGFSGVTRAQHVRSNSAALKSCPFCVVVKDEAWRTVLNRLKIPAILALLVAAIGLWQARSSGWWRQPLEGPMRGRVLLLTVGLFGFVWWLLIGIETQLGFSGNARYLVLGTAPVGIAGGVAWGWLILGVAGALRRVTTASAVRLATGIGIGMALLLAWPPWIGRNIISLPRTHHALVDQALLRENLNTIVKDYGGADRLLACGSVMTEGFQVPMVAWTLGVRTLRITDEPATVDAPASAAPNVILQARAQPHASLLPEPETIINWEREGVRYRLVDHVNSFRLFTACRR